MTQRLENIGQAVRSMEKDGFSTRDIILSLQVERKLIQVDVDVARLDRQMVGLNELLTDLDTKMSATKKNLDILTAKKYSPEVERVIASWEEIETKRKALSDSAKDPQTSIIELKKEIRDARKKIVEGNLPDDQISLLRQDLAKKSAEAGKKMTEVLKVEKEIDKATLQCNDVITQPLKTDNIPHENITPQNR